MTAGAGHFHDDAADRSRSFETETISINLRRTQLVGLVACADLAVQAGLGLVRGHAGLVAMAASGAALTLAFAAAAYAAGSSQMGVNARKALPLGLMITLLFLSQILAALGAPNDDLVNGYAIVLIGIAALFKISPRQFGMTAAPSFLVMMGLIVHAKMPAGIALQNVATAGFALIAALMIRNLLYRARQRDHQLRTIIADQNRALSKTNLELAQRNYEVRETMAIAAHDLRSPMAGLHSLLKFAADRPDMRPETLHGMLVEAGQSVGAMLDLVGRLVDAHEAGYRGPLELKTRELQTLARDAVDRIKITATALNVGIVLMGDEDAIPVQTDQDAVARILDNLLSNAVKYSSAGGTVYVMCRRGTGSATIEVLDEGIGIPPADESRIFDKFQRGSQLPIAGGIGAGLGLYIAREAATSISAQLDYRQRADGGSIFRLTMPSTPKPTQSND